MYYFTDFCFDKNQPFLFGYNTFINGCIETITLVFPTTYDMQIQITMWNRIKYIFNSVGELVRPISTIPQSILTIHKLSASGAYVFKGNLWHFFSF